MIIRHTQQRAAIRSALEQTGRPLSPLELLGEARKSLPDLGLATVYRAIKAMLAEKQAVEVKVPGEPDRYEAAGKSHHHHFLCRSCNRLFEIEGCPGNMHRLAPAGYAVESHELTLYGRCPTCQPAARRPRKRQNA